MQPTFIFSPEYCYCARDINDQAPCFSLFFSVTVITLSYVINFFKFILLWNEKQEAWGRGYRLRSYTTGIIGLRGVVSSLIQQSLAALARAVLASRPHPFVQ